MLALSMYDFYIQYCSLALGISWWQMWCGHGFEIQGTKVYVKPQPANWMYLKGIFFISSSKYFDSDEITEKTRK